MKIFKGYRTFAIALAVTIFGALETFDWTEFVTDENAGIIVAVIGAIIGVLRAFTNTAPGAAE